MSVRIHLYTTFQELQKVKASPNNVFRAWTKELMSPGDIHIDVPLMNAEPLFEDEREGHLYLIKPKEEI